MAIIRASKSFEGGDLTKKAASYLKSDVRVVDFKNKENGVYLFLLGAYKQDAAGNGVWYRPLKVRDNFGMGMYKEKFAIQPNCPVEYFANKVQTFAADMAKSRQVDGDDGKKRWVYPVWGRTAWRVLYNAAIFKDYGAGVHVLDLPMSGGGSVIDEHVKGKQADGSDNPDITNYEAAIPLNIKLDLKAQGQPWKIAIQTAKTYALPVELADTDYLYNLDDVINYPSKDELIEKLRSIVPTDIFDRGMEGYPAERTVVSMAQPRKAATPVPSAPQPVATDDVPMEYTAPAPVIPKTVIPRNNSVSPRVTVPSAPTDDDIPSAPQFKAPVNNAAAMTAALAFLKDAKK